MDEVKTGADVCEEIVLGAWHDDEEALGRIVSDLMPSILAGIAKAFPSLSSHDVEDVVCSGIADFWAARHKFDAKRPLRPYLYRCAKHHAMQLIGGRLNWQKSRNLERQIEPAEIFSGRDDPAVQEECDELEASRPEILIALRRVVEGLPVVQREVILAYAQAGDYVIDAGELGVELGRQFNDGVPYPASTIRAYHTKARSTIRREMKKRGFEPDNMGLDHE